MKMFSLSFEVFSGMPCQVKVSLSFIIGLTKG